MDVTWPKGQANFQCSRHVDIFLLTFVHSQAYVVIYLQSISPSIPHSVYIIHVSEWTYMLHMQLYVCPFDLGNMTLYLIFLLCLKVILFVSLHFFGQNENPTGFRGHLSIKYWTLTYVPIHQLRP